MRIRYKSLRIILSIVVSVLCGLMTLILIGLMLPMWIMTLIYGLEPVQDAPAHGGFILILTLPSAAIVVLCGIVPFGLFVYRKLS